jgi:hypothetical protein
MKKFNFACNKSALKPDIYTEGVFQMNEHGQFSAAELENKTVGELRALLADERLLTSDSDGSNELIFKISEAIHAKENKSNAQLEAERVRFWAGLIVRYGDKIPVKLEDVVRKSKIRSENGLLGAGAARRRSGYSFRLRKPVRRLAVAVALAAALLVCNSLIALAFNFNFLQTIVSFTDDLFVKTIVSTDNAPNFESPSHIGNSGEFASFQDALDELGIVRPQAPEKLPESFAVEMVQATERRDYVMAAAQYRNGDKTITITIRSYTNAPSERTDYTEKNAGVPDIYAYSGVEFYIFENMDRTVATWTDGMKDCSIQGNISAEEIKSIINSMYTED